jgi:hypothetical protein
MMNKIIYNRNNSGNRRGFVMLVTIVLLVIMSAIGYTISSQVATRRHRNQYIIDYSKARYSCDSAVKYVLAELQEIEPEIISRPNEPDFSDLYALNEDGYRRLLKLSGFDSKSSATGESENDLYVIRGPYGPQWPFIIEAAEFTIDSAKVRIEVHDENAKYPVGWLLLNDKQREREIQAGYVTFCEMMGMSAEQIESLRTQLTQIGQIRPFKVEFKPITTTVSTAISNTGSATARTTTAAQLKRVTTTVATQITEQTTTFAKLFHSSLLDIENLARPIIDAGFRQESPLKYLGVWGSRQVNINTAPRAVLEAAFIFGGNEVEIAEEIIQRRRKEPFTSIENLKKDLVRYSDSIEKSEYRKSSWLSSRTNLTL